MRHWLRKHLRSISTALIAALAGLWLVGTCAAAQLPCNSPCTKTDPSHEMTMPCEQAAAPCELPSLNILNVPAFDFSVTPVVLTTLPIELVIAQSARALSADWRATHPPSVPLYLTHLALLN